MPLTIHPVLPTDASAWVHLQFDAFADDPVSALMYPVPASPSVLAWSIDQFRHGWGQNPLERRLKIVDSHTGEMVAVALWLFFPDRCPSGEKNGAEQEWTAPPRPQMEYHEEYVKEAWELLMASSWETRNEIMGGRPYAFLCNLHTHPSHRRRGAATLLLEWGLHQAHAANLPVYLLASPRGRPLYEKHHFRALRQVPIHRPLTSTTVLQVNTCMILDAPHPLLPPIEKPPIHDAGKFFIEPVTQESDFLRLAVIESRAFTDDPVMSLCFPPDPDPEKKQGDAHHAAEMFKDSRDDASTRYAKATDLATGEIVAWAKWHFFESPSAEADSEGTDDDYGPNANVALCNHFFGALDEQRKGYMKGKNHCLMSMLATLPEYQRRGIGSQLLRQGLEEADEKGYDSWINASPQGLELYKRHGWEEMGFVDIDLGKWGGGEDVIDRTVCMLRRPKVKGSAY